MSIPWKRKKKNVNIDILPVPKNYNEIIHNRFYKEILNELLYNMNLADARKEAVRKYLAMYCDLSSNEVERESNRILRYIPIYNKKTPWEV